MGIYFIAAGRSTENRTKTLDRGWPVDSVGRFLDPRTLERLKSKLEPGDLVYAWGANKPGDLPQLQAGDFVIDVKNKEVVQVFEFCLWKETSDTHLQEFFGWDSERPLPERRPYRFVYFLRKPQPTRHTQKSYFQKAFAQEGNPQWLAGQAYFNDSEVQHALERTESQDLEELLGMKAAEEYETGTLAKAAKSTEESPAESGFYWVTVGMERPENWETALGAGVWGVPDDYRDRVRQVSQGDYLVFYGKRLGFAVCRIESEAYSDDERIWSDGAYPHRVRISQPLRVNRKMNFGDVFDCLRDASREPYKSAKAAGRGIGGRNGVMRPLERSELKCLFDRLGWEELAGVTTRPVETSEPEATSSDSSSIWWVNQGKTYSHEREGGYIWAPKQAKSGATFGHHEAVARVHAGEVIVHYASGAIRALGEATENGRDEVRPEDLPEQPWDREGYLAPLQYWELDEPIELNEVPSEWRTDATSGPFDVNGAVKQGYLFLLEPDLAGRLRRRFADRWPPDSPWGGEEPMPALLKQLTLSWLEERTLWNRGALEELVEAVAGPSPQIVLAGPPGTSKTWVAMHVARYITNDNPSARKIVQFHPSYSYEEFIEGLRPVSKDGAISFEQVPGVVLRMAEDMRPSDTRILLVDEMNRANLPRVFGELMYLFEYRDERIDLQYSEGFSLPPGLKFIGTMNTADRSIRSIDIALRRRFDVFECRPDVELLERYYKATGYQNKLGSTLFEGLRRLNERLELDLDRHHTIGHTFFMSDVMTTDRLDKIWARKLQPLIEEYFFDQEDVAAEYALEEFWPQP